MKCDEFKKLKWQEDKKNEKEAQQHLLICNECSAFKQEYDSIVSVLKIKEERLNIYQRIKPIILEEINKGQMQKRAIYSPTYVNLRWALPVAASFIIIFVLVFYMQTISLDKGREQINAKINIISMVDTPEGILVKWHDAKKDEYILIRSIDPKGSRNAVKIKVKGNCYLDKDANNYPIVYYKVL